MGYRRGAPAGDGLVSRWAAELHRSSCHDLLSPHSAGDNDATVLLKQQSGSRRWQHLAAGGGAALEGQGAGAPAAGGRAAGASSPVEQNYTVILGSHRNSCLKFEKDGELCCMVR